MRVVVLGAGFGGLELTTSLSEKFGDDAKVVLIDQSDDFIFGFSKLDVMFGRTSSAAVRHPYRDFVKPGVRFVHATVTKIDPAAKRVETDGGAFDADILVVALGADLDPQSTPGLLEWGHDFYSEDAALALRDVLEHFAGGRVIVGVMSTPFKCPPAPSEAALLMHDFLIRRGLRERSEIALVMPLPVPIPPSQPRRRRSLVPSVTAASPGTQTGWSRSCERVSPCWPTGPRFPSIASSGCRPTACPASWPTRA